MNGSPTKPVGHEQVARWLAARHSAFFAQGSDTEQGLTHWRLRQVSAKGQSSFDLQPGSSTGAKTP